MDIDHYPTRQPHHGLCQITKSSELQPDQAVYVHVTWNAEPIKQRLTVKSVDTEDGYIQFREWVGLHSLRDLGVLPYDNGCWHPQHWIQRTYKDLTNTEIKAALNHICNTATSDDEMRRLLLDELSYSDTVTVMWLQTPHGLHLTVMIFGQRGDIISFSGIMKNRPTAT